MVKIEKIYLICLNNNVNNVIYMHKSNNLYVKVI